MTPQATNGEDGTVQHIVYLGLGSNLGDRAANLYAAMAALAPELRLTAVSAVYETAPMHVEDQPDFLNLVCAGRTALAPLPLLRRLKQIERELGRLPGPRYGPRAIDLDLLLYDDIVLSTPELSVPHPRMLERAFVLAPLAEIAPALRHPLWSTTAAALAASRDAAGVRRIGPLLPASE